MLSRLHRRLLIALLVLGGISLFFLIAFPPTRVAAALGVETRPVGINVKSLSKLDQSNSPGMGILAPDAPPTPTQTTIDSDIMDPSLVGESYIITFSVRALASVSDPVGGTVVVSDGAGATCSRYYAGFPPPFIGWQWNCWLTSTTAGSKLLTATFTPDNPSLFIGSTSAPEPHQVNKANTTTAVTYAPASPKACTNITLTAAVSPVSPGGGTPASGTVTFYEGALNLGSGTYAGSGQWNLVTTLLPGWHSIHAVYGGNSNYNGSTAPVNLFNVGKADSVTTITTLSPNPSIFGNAVTVRATSSGGCGTPTGTVNFYESGSPVGSASLNGSGVADLIVYNFSVGAHVMSATYTGDTLYAGSSSGNHTHNVNKRNVSSVTVTSSLNPSVYGQSVAFTANVASDISTKPTGEVVFKDGASSLGTRTLDASGQATLSTSSLTVGSHSITVEYQGDSNFNTGASPALTQQVNKADTSAALTSSSSPSTYGQNVSFMVTVTPVSPGSGTPDGSVTFKDDGVAIGTDNLNASGQATLNTSSLSVGLHFITAEYSGSSSFNSSISNSITFQVNKGNTSTVLVSSGSPSSYGQMVTFTATVSVVSGSGTPTGTVIFKDSGVPVGAGSLNGAGQASFSIASLAVGSHSMVAEYMGDANFNGSTSSSLAHQVNKANSATTLIASAPTSLVGQTVVFTATVTAVAPGSGLPGGAVIFWDSGIPLGTIPLSGSGRAVFSTASLSAGSHVITAEYGGDANFNVSVSSPLTHQVNISDSVTSLSASSLAPTEGETVVFTATVTSAPPGSGSPGGSVIFWDDGIPLATLSLSGSGKAVFSTASLPAGPHTLMAEYSGDGIFNGSVSPPLAVTILTQADISIEKAGGPGTAYAGEQKQYQIWITNHGPSQAQNVVMQDVLPDEMSYQIDTSGGSCTQPTTLVGLRASLNGGNEVPPVSTSASGLATLVLDTTNNQLDYAIQASQIGSVIAVHLHTGAAGVNGPILVTLYSGMPLFDPTHPLVNRVLLNPADAAAILANPASFYLNVQTTAHPSGEIRGQLAQALNTPLKCELGGMQPNQSSHVEIYATTSPQAIPNTTITNVAMVSSLTDLGDPILWNNLSSADNLILGKADLKVAKYGKPDDEVRAGERLTYTVMVDNLGPGFAHTVALTDTLHASDAFHLLSLASNRPAVCSPTSGSFTGALQIHCELTDPLEAMTPGHSGRWTLTMVVTAEETQSINNSAYVVSADLDPNLSNNQASVEHDITDVADLNILKTAIGEVQVDGQPGGTVTLIPDQVTAGRSLTYTLIIINQGPSTAENVLVQDSLPGWIEVQDIIPSQGICNWGTPGDPLDKMTCGLGDLPASISATVIIHMNVPSWMSNGTQLHNDALVFSDIFDPNNADNYAANQVTINTWSDLSVLKVQQPASVPGGTITYTILVSNSGPSSNAYEVQVLDLKPSELINVTWECVASRGAYCASYGSGSIDEKVYLPLGETLTYTIRGSVSSPTTFTNTVRVVPPAQVPDPYMVNNQASVENIPYIYFFPFVTHSSASIELD